MRGLNNYYGTELKTYVKKYFGSWNNCLKELGLKLNSISHYTDEELDDAFISFIINAIRYVLIIYLLF